MYDWEIGTLESVIRNMKGETSDIEHLIEELLSVVTELEDKQEQMNEEG